MAAVISCSMAVYPRVGGGNGPVRRPPLRKPGLSPRGRGKRRWKCCSLSSRRSIPAWAGETAKSRRSAASAGVYPRVGGGNYLTQYWAAASPGLSPRGRGKQGAACFHHAWAGSIPAWAGETRPATATGSRPGVYPRVGGGNLRRAVDSRPLRGLSPRGRGKPGGNTVRPYASGSIPAWAGETIPWAGASRAGWVYPRVGGGNPGIGGS